MKKRCGRCQEVKPVTEFWRCKRDGYQSMCKTCKRGYQSSLKGKESAKRSTAKWAATERGKRSLRAAQARYRAVNPASTQPHRKTRAFKDRSIAYVYVRRLRKRGALPNVCAMKSRDCRGRLEAHHHNGYAREHRTDVVILCAHHHLISEKELRRRKAERAAGAEE